VLRLNFEKRAEDYAEIQRKTLAIGKHLLHRGYVSRVDQGQLFELAHAAGAFGAGEMAFAGMRADDLAGRRELEALGGAAMRFQLLLWLGRISWHCRNLSKKFLRETELLGRVRGLLRTWFCRGSSLFGCQQRDQNVPFHARHRFDLAEVADFIEQARHLGAAHFLVRHFAPAMKNHGAHFVAFPEEANDLVLANLVIVLRGGRPKFDFLELRATAALALLMRLFILLVKKFAVVGDLANRRIGGGRDLHQVESLFARQTNSLERLHHPKLGTFFINHPDFARPDPLVDAGTVALPEAAFCDNSP